MVTPVHTTVATECQFVPSGRNSRAAFDLLVTHRILQYIAYLLAVDIEFRQGTVLPLPDAFYVYRHFVNTKGADRLACSFLC